MFKAFTRMLAAPTQAASAARDERELTPNVRFYAAFVLASMLLFWLKPFDFPDANAPLPRETQSLRFWFQVLLWQPPLEAAWIAAVLGLVEWLRRGSLGVRLTLAVAWAAAPVLLIIAYAERGGGLGKGGLALGLLVCFGLFAPLLARAPEKERMPTASFLLGLNAIGLAMLAAMAAAVLLRLPPLFQGAQIAGGLWMIGAATLGVRELTGLRLPRAFMAVFLSLLFQMTFAIGLFFIGVVPKDILKALLYA